MGSLVVAVNTLPWAGSQRIFILQPRFYRLYRWRCHCTENQSITHRGVDVSTGRRDCWEDAACFCGPQIFTPARVGKIFIRRLRIRVGTQRGSTDSVSNATNSFTFSRVETTFFFGYPGVGGATTDGWFLRRCWWHRMMDADNFWTEPYSLISWWTVLDFPLSIKKSKWHSIYWGENES